MNVLHIITSLGTGGAEKLLADSIPLYRQKGINAEVLVLDGTEYPFFLKLKKENIPVYSLSTGSIKKVYNPLNIFMLIPWIDKYDIVHVHLFPSLYWVALAKIIGRSKAYLVFTEHSTSNRRIRWKVPGRFEAFIYNKYERIISVTGRIDTVQRRRFPNIDGSKFHVVNNGINLSAYNKNKNKNIRAGMKIIIQVSSFRKQKDQKTVIRVLQYLPENVLLKLAGDGENKIKCQKLAASLGLSHRVLFLGVRQDIPELLSSADIVVLSSRYEGLSLSCIEGMASGRPFVASDVPGLRDIVSGAGILFPEKDEHSLADIFRKLLNDDALYRDVTEKCVKRAMEYDIRAMADSYVGIYNEII